MITAKEVLFLWTIKRGGGHGVVEWIRGLDKSIVFFNNVPPYNCTREDLRPQSLEDVSYKSLMLGIEDWPYSSMLSCRDALQSAKNPVKCDIIKNIIVLRDPFNTFASRFKFNETDKKMDISSDIMCFWKKLAKEIVGDTNVVENKIPILFNKWFIDKDYRKRTAIDLGKRFNDSRFGKMHKVYHSSFDGNKYRNNCQNMDVFNRWRFFADNKEYRALFDQEVIDLSSRIFDFVPSEFLSTSVVQMDAPWFSKPKELSLSLAVPQTVH